MFQKRTYREYTHNSPLLAQTVRVEESDLQIYAEVDVRRQALPLLQHYRQQITDYIKRQPEFSTSLEPLTVATDAPPIVQRMAEAAHQAGVGPMAAVAGAISEFVGRELLSASPNLIIENGGDIFLAATSPKKALVYAGESSFSNKLAVEISPDQTPLGICTSAGTVGHSLSFGQADAVMVISKDTLLADACATSIGNRVKTPADIDTALQFARSVPGIMGVVIIIQESLGVWGEIKLVAP